MRASFTFSQIPPPYDNVLGQLYEDSFSSTQWKSYFHIFAPSLSHPPIRNAINSSDILWAKWIPNTNTEWGQYRETEFSPDSDPFPDPDSMDIPHWNLFVLDPDSGFVLMHSLQNGYLSANTIHVHYRSKIETSCSPINNTGVYVHILNFSSLNTTTFEPPRTRVV